MLAAGNGNLCRGFENVLDLYLEAHNQGFRPNMPLSFLSIGRPTTNNPNSEESVGDKVREDRRNE